MEIDLSNILVHSFVSERSFTLDDTFELFISRTIPLRNVVMEFPPDRDCEKFSFCLSYQSVYVKSKQFSLADRGLVCKDLSIGLRLGRQRFFICIFQRFCRGIVRTWCTKQSRRWSKKRDSLVFLALRMYVFPEPLKTNKKGKNGHVFTFPERSCAFCTPRSSWLLPLVSVFHVPSNFLLKERQPDSPGPPYAYGKCVLRFETKFNPSYRRTRFYAPLPSTTFLSFNHRTKGNFSAAGITKDS